MATLNRKSNRWTIFVPRSDETKLKAIEIAAILQERFAFLSGAQAKNGSLIVTLPEYPKFADINERDTEKVFKYLVSLVSEGQLKNGFILVLDRRKDKWNAVKGSLHRIQKCFPGTINTILVLKPQGFFQKYSKPSFLTDGIISERRIEVNCLNSPSDLEEHIDNSQLTADLGGSLDYNHTQWVQHRTAIERREGNLASFEKRIEGLRQTYSGTKLSSSVEEVEQLLQAQEDMWRDLKEDMTSDRETGATLLDCIHPKKRNGDENSFTPDIKANAAELKRILNRLDEMKENFEKYWKEHKQRIQYSLKVCVFELEINQRDEVDNRADNPDAPKKRMQVLMELIGTEKDYVSDLGCVINGYLKEFDQAGKKIPADLHGKKNIIFGNIEQIYEFHQHEFLCELESCLDQPSLVGGVFIGKSDEFEMYATYCKNKPTSEALRYEYMNLPFFKECQMRLGHRLPLNAYLLKPVQRITKYQLLLNEMMKYTEHSNWRYADLEKALETMKNVLRHVNDVMHSCGLKGFPGNIAEQGKLLLQDSFMVWQRHKNFNLAPLKGKQRQVFLYQKVLILSKKDEETRKETVLYHYKNSVKMCDVGMTETVPDAPNKFELWMEGRSEVFVLQAMSFEVKNRWVTMIRNVLLSQFNEVKEAVSEQSGLHDRWKSNPAISTRPSNSSPQQLRSRSQSYLSIASATHGSNRYSDILERPGESENDTENEDVDDFDSDEFSESDDGENPSSSDVPEIKYSEDPQPLYAQDTSYEGTRYSAIADYTAVESTELSFVKGDTLEVLRVGQEGWWFARLTPLSQGGWVPASYLELQMSTS